MADDTQENGPGPAARTGTPRVLRAMNDRAALDLLLAHGPLSRTRIGRLTGLSKPTASQLLARLEAAGLVVATGTSEGRPGPSAQLYAVNPAAAHVAGLDVTAARIRAAVADITGRTVGTYELATGKGGSGGAVPQVLRAVDGAAKAAGLIRADLHHTVIGTPGAFDPSTGRLRYALHLPGWHSPTLLAELAAALPMPVAYDNDVNLAAVAEQRLGAARGHDDFVLLWNQEGIGAAVVIGGRLHRGFTGGAGEVAFLPVPGSPLLRHVSRVNTGGFQELAGSTAVLPLAQELGVPAPARRGKARLSVVQAAAGVIATAARTPTGAHAELLRRFATRTATGLASIVAVLDPEVIVLSGTLLAAGGETLRALVQSELTELAAPNTRLVAGEVVDDPVLSGALQSALATTRDEVFDTSA